MPKDPINLSKHNNRVAALIAVAMDLGYSATQTPKLFVTLHAPVHGKSIRVPPLGTWNAKRLRGLARQIIRYGDPVQKRMMLSHVIHELPPELAQIMTAASALNELNETADQHHPQVTPKDRDLLTGTDGPNFGVRLSLNPASKLPSSPDYQPPERKPRPTPAPTPEPAPPPPPASARPPFIVGETHRVSRRGTRGGLAVVYDSDAVIQRTWSDGHIDYACAWKRCKYTSDNPTSVANHYGRSKTHKKVPEPITVIDASMPPSGVHRNRDLRISRLAAELKAVWPGECPSPEELAAAIIDGRIAAHGDDEPAEPLTPEQIIERIRRLVDRGDYIAARDEALAKARQADELRERAETEANVLRERAERAERAEAELAAARTEATKQANRADQAEGRWEALRSLVTEDD